MAGRVGAADLGLAGAGVCAEDTKTVDNKVVEINVAVSIDLMTNPVAIEARAIKHICLGRQNPHDGSRNSRKTAV
jgi:hypothetical protein